MLGTRDNNPMPNLIDDTCKPILITIRSRVSEDDEQKREVVFGLYDVNVLEEKDGKFSFTTSVPDEYNLGLGGLINLLLFKQIYAVMYGSNNFCSGATAHFESGITEGTFVAPLELFNPSSYVSGIDNIFGDKYVADGLSLVMIIPNDISIESWIINFMVEHFKCALS